MLSVYPHSWQRLRPSGPWLTKLPGTKVPETKIPETKIPDVNFSRFLGG